MSDILTLKDIAAYLKVHPSTVYRLLRRKAIPTFKIGTHYRFNRELIDKWRTALEDEHRP